jgi:hypothetical protein
MRRQDQGYTGVQSPGMRAWIALTVFLPSLAVLGCARDDREWLKVDRRYTREEFQRDYKECTRKGDVDDSCMRQRGWVPVNPTKEEAPKSMDPLSRGRGRY